MTNKDDHEDIFFDFMYSSVGRLVSYSMHVIYRPYHSVLLIVSEQEIIDAIPHDSSPSIVRLIQVASPLKSLQNLSSDADISLAQVGVC